MGRSPLLLCIVVLALAACGSDARNVTEGSRPRLVQDVTIAPTTPAPTRYLSPTPTLVVIPVSTSEIISPLQVPTIQADFVLVTPTLPPSKTPTQTPTQTATFTQTPPPSPTFEATPTSPPLPTAVFVTAIPVNSQPCGAAWFFVVPRPDGCPLNAPLGSYASFQQFQQGYMIWIQQQDAIYVLYDSANFPRWEVYQDTFEEWMPAFDPLLDDLAPPYTFQPKRGFGVLWRSSPAIQRRLGWSVREWEEPYNTQVQIGQDGTVYLQDSRGGVITLKAGGTNWERWLNQ
jgi:hypothetical protein